MKNKILSMLAVLAVAVNMVGCTPSDTAAPVEAAEQVTEETAEAIEMKTIEPPEDGWTVEQLNEVMYLNGKPFKLPCTVDELGGGFSIENVKEKHDNPFRDNRNPFDYMNAILFYNNQEFGRIYMTCDGEIWGISQLKSSVENESKVNLDINGVNINCSKTDVEKLIGSKFNESKNNGSYTYRINDNSLLTVGYIVNSDLSDQVTDEIFSIAYCNIVEE